MKRIEFQCSCTHFEEEMNKSATVNFVFTVHLDLMVDCYFNNLF